MKKYLVLVCCAVAFLGAGCNDSSESVASATAHPQIGVNFIRYFWGDESSIPLPQRKKQGGTILDTTVDFVQPKAIFASLADAGVQVERQLMKADLTWGMVEPSKGTWNFTAADQVIGKAGDVQIIDLFASQYASPTPPWAKAGEFQKTLGPEAKEYLDQVITRYGASVKYWEIGNEMDHWRSEDPADAATNHPKAAASPRVSPEGGFSPKEQGAFIAEVASYVRSKDPDAVIVLPGMSSINDYTLNTWLPGVLEGAGADAFDVVNYHDYQPWNKMPAARAKLSAFLTAHNMKDKPVWLTETGVTSEPSLTSHTNYPNSEASQAADVFRRIIPAYAQGDGLVIWHTFIGSKITSGNAWGGFGLLTDTGAKKLSFWSYQLLAKHLLPFASVTQVTAGTNQYVYKVTKADGKIGYVMWGSGDYTLPADGQYTSVVAQSSTSGGFTWKTATAGTSVTLTDIPLILE